MQDLLNPGNAFPAQPSPHASCVVRFQGDVWAFLSYHSILPQKQEPGNLQLCRIVISGVKNSKQMSTTCLGSRPFSWADLGGWRAAPFLTKGLQEEKHPECRRVTARVRSCSPLWHREHESSVRDESGSHFSGASLKAEWTPTEWLLLPHRLWFFMGDSLNHCCYRISHGFTKAVLGMNTGRQRQNRSPDSPCGGWIFCCHWKDGHAPLQLCQTWASEGLEIIHVTP